MNIESKEVLSKKKVGLRKNKPVYAIATVGGLHLIIDESGLLGMSSHPALARHVAGIQNPDIQYTELAKSEALDPRQYAAEIAKWSKLTNAFNSK